MTMRDLPAQFINWRSVRRESGKTDKIPFDPLSRLDINAHDPANWRTYDQAVATGEPVGFVLTANDPYFFIDLDDCRQGDAWIPEAVAIVSQFPGAAIEVSASATGLHIIGRCDQSAVINRRNKWGKGERPGVGHWKEFYTNGRFIAFGPYGWQGNPNLDFTASVLNIVPERDLMAAISGDGPDPRYTGPSDDNELITRMLAAKGSVGAMMGDKASLRDLWYAKEYPWKLQAAFPSPSDDVYDRSSADAALMSHLAFWTGRDAVRMDRLFRRSGLMRDKYEKRPDYREATIKNAIAACQRVYDYVKESPVPNNGTSPPTSVAGEVLTISEQIEHFKGCVYVRDMHRVMIPGGDILKPEQFRVIYGGKQFVMSNDGTGPTKNAFEAFTENRAWQFPKVRSICFRPKASPGAIIDDKVNVYWPEPREFRTGDVSPFLDLVQRLLPNERDRTILLSYAASLVQNPGVKFQWAPVVQGTEGNGKTIIMKCIEYAIGERYTHFPASNDLANPFNAYLENKLFIGVEEVHLDGKRELLDTLKPLITNDRVEVQLKGVDKRMIDNFTNWYFNTNHRDAVVKTINDRRYAILFTAQQTFRDIERDGMSGEYFPRLYDWLRSGGYEFVARWLNDLRIAAEFDPAGLCHRAPMTSTTDDAIVASRGRAEQEIMEAIESEEMGFRQGWASSVKINDVLSAARIRMGPNKIKAMMESLGYQDIGRASRNVMQEDNKRPVLYVRVERLQPGLTVEDYCRAQGYTGAIVAPVVMDFPGLRSG